VAAARQSTHHSSDLPGEHLRGETPVAEFAASALRAALFEGELRPGDQVNQYVWAERLGVSRAALREDLEVLASTKVLDHDPNRGYRVSEMGLPEMAELY
jgi:DNA-binding GntR family transcriptional regulator